MRAFFTNRLGFKADLCLMVNGHSTRVTVRMPEGPVMFCQYYDTWDEALEALRSLTTTQWVNDMTHEIIEPMKEEVKA